MNFIDKERKVKIRTETSPGQLATIQPRKYEEWSLGCLYMLALISSFYQLRIQKNRKVSLSLWQYSPVCIYSALKTLLSLFIYSER